MRHVARQAVNALTLLSLLLFVAILFVWVSGYALLFGPALLNWFDVQPGDRWVKNLLSWALPLTMAALLPVNWVLHLFLPKLPGSPVQPPPNVQDLRRLRGIARRLGRYAFNVAAIVGLWIVIGLPGLWLLEPSQWYVDVLLLPFLWGIGVPWAAGILPGLWIAIRAWRYVRRHGLRRTARRAGMAICVLLLTASVACWAVSYFVSLSASRNTEWREGLKAARWSHRFGVERGRLWVEATREDEVVVADMGPSWVQAWRFERRSAKAQPPLSSWGKGWGAWLGFSYDHCVVSQPPVPTWGNWIVSSRVSVREGTIPLALPALLFGILPAMACRRALRERRARRWKGHCRHCGYDLTGNVSGVCPECGIKVETRP